MKIHKRPVLLLEVMIAIALIVMAAIPLIYPHLYLLKAQRHFMSKVELDHAVNLLYVDLLEQMYENKVSWTSIISKNEFKVEKQDFRRIGYTKPVPFKGAYRFTDSIHKPKGEEEVPFRLYIISLDYQFYPEKEQPTKDNTINYHYDLFVVRDLVGEGLPQGDDSTVEPEEEEP